MNAENIIERMVIVKALLYKAGLIDSPDPSRLTNPVTNGAKIKALESLLALCVVFFEEHEGNALSFYEVLDTIATNIDRRNA